MDYFKKIIFILLLIFNFSIANASTSEFIGVIGAAIGEIKNQKEEVLINGSKIYYGDTIIVGQQSNAQILFLDQTVITVGEKSELTIDEFIYDPDTNDGKFVSNIKSGTVKIITGEISKKNPDNLEIKIPTGTIGARGTEFVVLAESSKESTVVLLGPGPKNTLGMIAGNLEVSDGINSVNIIQPGFETVVSN
tara:strand:+ start:1639 stop:2217 length:579 start_codon:yes stop_codon:yes gene_type:complete